MNNSSSIPTVGKNYNFYDGGKISDTRQYFAKCTEIIDVNEAKGTLIRTSYPYDTSRDDNNEYDETLYNVWRGNIEYSENMCINLYSNETDYFIRCEIPEYDDNDIWFVRGEDGRWWSLEIQSSWQCGLLDVDCEYKCS